MENLFEGILQSTQKQHVYINRADNKLRMEAWDKYDKLNIFRMTRGLDKRHPSLTHLISKDSLISSSQNDLDILIDHAMHTYDQISSRQLNGPVAATTDELLKEYTVKVLHRKLKNAKDMIALKIIDTSYLCRAMAEVEEKMGFDFDEISRSPTLRSDVLTIAYPSRMAMLKTIELEMYSLKEFFELERYWLEANLEASPDNAGMLSRLMKVPTPKAADAFASKVIEYYTQNVMKKCQFRSETFQ